MNRERQRSRLLFGRDSLDPVPWADAALLRRKDTSLVDVRGRDLDSIFGRRLTIPTKWGGGGDTVQMSFESLLTVSLVPSTALGSSTPTFTRNSTPAQDAYQTDFEGKLNLVLKNEARFQGARRVRNLILGSSVDMTASPWADYGVVTTRAATSITFAANASNGVTQPFGGGAGVTSTAQIFVIRATVSTNSGTKGFRFQITKPNVADYTSSDLTATTTPQVWTTTHTTAAGTDGIAFYIRNSSDGAAGTINVTSINVQDVTGQANQVVGEDVSVGVLSAPFHGAGVDGVKYFDTLNGNTVASNVVTEATGAAITSAAAEAAGGVTAGVVDAYGPYGYLAEGARTNLVLQSQTLGTTWTVGNANTSLSADSAVAPDGTTTADKIIEADTASALRYYTQDVTLTVASYTASVYAKAGERTWVGMQVNGGTNEIQPFNLSGAGTVGSTVSGTHTATITALESGWYRLTMTLTGSVAAWNVRLYITDGDKLISTAYTGVANSGAYFWGAQLELGSFASTYIPTTTVAVARNADVLTYATSGNVAAAQGTAYAEISNSWTGVQNATARVLDLSTVATAPVLYFGNSGGLKLSIYDGTTESLNSAFTASASVQKIASYWGGSTMGTVVGGTLGTPVAFDGAVVVGTTMNVGQDFTGASQLFGTIRNVRIYPSALAPLQLQAMTT